MFGIILYMKILNIFRKKYIYRLLVIVSILLNILFIFFTNSPAVPLSRQVVIGSNTPYDNSDTIYLAHGVVAFQDKSDQPKETYQIMTFYMDAKSQEVFVDEVFFMGQVLTFMGRDKLDILSFDATSKILTLTGDGWKKVIIDGEKKQVVEATDSDGDVVYLKSSWDIE